MASREIDVALTQPPHDAAAVLAAVPEDQWFERKSGRVAPRDLAVTLVALANAEGGHVVAGIHAGRIDGVTRVRENALRQTAHDFTTPVVRADVESLRVAPDRTLLVFRVAPGQQVHETVRGDCYLRVGDESRRLNYTQRRELEYDRGPTPFDGTHVAGSSGDLARAELEAYQNHIGASGVDAVLRARDLLTRDGSLTVAAWLLFAERPQAVFPSAFVRVLRYANNERGTGAEMSLYDEGDVRFEGSLPQQIEQAAELIDRWVPKVQALAQDGRFKPRPIIPRHVWLEGLVNAVLHRSYAMAGDHIRVEIFPNRIEIFSPGRFPGLANPANPLEITRYARNPRISRVCTDLGIARELGEGIKRIFAEMRSVGLTDPIYTQTNSSVRLTLSASDALADEVRERLPRGALNILGVLRQDGRPLGTGQVADLAGVTRPTAIRHLQTLRDHDLVEWNGESRKDPRASWRLRLQRSPHRTP